MFLVGCCPCPPAGFPVPVRSRLLGLMAGVDDPRNSATGHVSVVLMWTSSINASTVVRSVDLGNGLPFSHRSQPTKKLVGVLVDLPQQVNHEARSDSVLEEPLVRVQCIPQLQYPLHVRTPISKQYL